MAPGAERTGRARAEEREAAKARRQRIFIAAGGVVLLGLVGFQLPGLLGSSSGPGRRPAPPAASAAVRVAPRAAAASGASDSPVSRSIARLSSRDLFLPQVSTSAGATASGAAGVTLKGPAVRAKDFVAKDLFVPQVKPPATAAAPSTVTSTGGTASAGASSATSQGGGYIVVIASIPGIGSSSQKAAARALVAAKNAGLKDVVANDAVPGESGAAAHFTVYTGPYPTEAAAGTELIRALRNGYPHARAQQLPSSSGKGF